MDYDGTCDEYDDVFFVSQVCEVNPFLANGGRIAARLLDLQFLGHLLARMLDRPLLAHVALSLASTASALQTSLGFRARRLAAEPLTLSLPVPLPWGFSNALVEAAASGSVIYLPAEAAASVIDLPAEAADAPLVLAEAAGRLAPVEAR